MSDALNYLIKARPEANAVVHTHSIYATALSCLRKDIPAFHYMIGIAGGTTLRCASYAEYGTQGLSDAMLKAMKDRQACLLANHGQIAFGDALARGHVGLGRKAQRVGRCGLGIEIP